MGTIFCPMKKITLCWDKDKRHLMFQKHYEIFNLNFTLIKTMQFKSAAFETMHKRTLSGVTKWLQRL